METKNNNKVNNINKYALSVWAGLGLAASFRSAETIIEFCLYSSIWGLIGVAMFKVTRKLRWNLKEKIVKG